MAPLCVHLCCNVCQHIIFLHVILQRVSRLMWNVRYLSIVLNLSHFVMSRCSQSLDYVRACDKHNFLLMVSVVGIHAFNCLNV